VTALTASPQITDGYNVTVTSQVDRVIRVSTAVAVLAVAGVAAYVSYWHAYAVVRVHGESGITARLEPATIDGLVYASSMVILYAARHGNPVPRLARWLLGLGIAATLMANMAQGWSHGLVGAAVAAWAAISLVGSYELLVWLIRSAGALQQSASGAHCRKCTYCHDVMPPAPSASVNGEQHGPSGRGSAAAQAAQPIRHWNTATDTERQEGADEDVNRAAVIAYQLSVQAGNPLSERKLAQRFGRTSRRWARARITEARKTQLLPDAPRDAIVSA
jgi:Protein of unknown function (DUF2637)